MLLHGKAAATLSGKLLLRYLLCFRERVILQCRDGTSVATANIVESILKKTALVTGGSRGIGRAICLKLAEQGYNVAFCYQSNSEAAKEVRQAIEKYDVRTYVEQCDVSKMENAKRFFSAVQSELGEISVLINFAGIINDAP